MNQRVITVNFGTGKGGLSTVGYTVYTTTGTTHQARTTSGVVELGSSTGIYTAKVALSEGFDGIVVWDTGDATIRYGVESTLSQLNAIQEETDRIRFIWNSLRNQGKMYETLLERLNVLQPTKPKDYEAAFKSLAQQIKAIAPPTLAEIRQALTVTVPAPEVPAPIVKYTPPPVKVNYTPPPVTVAAPDIKIPDYTEAFKALSQQLALLIEASRSSVEPLSAQLASLADELKTLDRIARGLETKLGGVAGQAQVAHSVDQVRQAIREVKDELDATIKNHHGLEAILKRIEALQQNKRVQQTLASLGLDF